MGSLALIQNYDSSDEAEEEVVLTTVNSEPSVRLPRPNLPEYGILPSITRQPVDAALTSDHQNRVRSFAHEAGNWATYVAIPINHHSEWYDVIQNLLDEKLSEFDLKLVEGGFHISLSRVVVMKYHWINGFIGSIRNIITSASSFPLTLRGLSVYVNDDRTRTFLGVNVETGKDYLNYLVNQIDDCLAEYNLPEFYAQRSFHTSILWGLGDISEKLNAALNKFDPDLFFLPLTVNHCFCKTGNKVYQFNLK